MPTPSQAFLRSACAIGGLLATTLACAHELPADRLALVQRDATHLSLQLLVDLPALLHRTLSPQTPRAEFLLALSAQSPEQIDAAMVKLRARVEPALRLTANGAALTLSHWHWPSRSQVQALLQQRAMRLVVAPAEHAHDEPQEVTADAVAQQPLARVQVDLPPEMRPLMLVNYRPRQRWVDAGAGPVSLEF